MPTNEQIEALQYDLDHPDKAIADAAHAVMDALRHDKARHANRAFAVYRSAKVANVDLAFDRLLAAARETSEHDLPDALDCMDHVIANAVAEDPRPRYPRISDASIKKAPWKARAGVRLVGTLAGCTGDEADQVMDRFRVFVAERVAALRDKRGRLAPTNLARVISMEGE